MRFFKFFVIHFFLLSYVFGQSSSFQTYVNPIIPGDHPDPTLTKIGNDFYTSGSSFNPTPKIYHSTDLVHWEVIAQPVSAQWSGYGDEAGGGIWGGHMVYHNGKYWHYFGRGGGSMYLVTADQPEGPWGSMKKVAIPTGLSGLGVDNSIFIDEDTDKWYMLTKNGQENNHIIELGDDGQPNGVVLDLTWLNPDSEGNPYGWAEGPVMWKHNGYYYYSFAQHLVGSQYVMRSDTLTDDESAWTIKSGTIFTGTVGTYNHPNHIAPAVTLDDGTSWTIAHSYNGSSAWYAQGRQGLLCQVTYDEDNFPVIQYPSNNAVEAPALPSNGIPWTVPKSDMFEGDELSPQWSHLGFTRDITYSLTERDGWLYLENSGANNTVIQNDGEHNYTLITKVDFEPESSSDEAGLWIINGPETLYAKVFSSVNSEGQSIIAFSFDDTSYETENTAGKIVWLKLIRNEHTISGFYSEDGVSWTQVGNAIDAAALDIQQTDYNDFTGNQQGLYVAGKYAFFDLYIYQDAYSEIHAQRPANFNGITTSSSYLYGIENDDWAMYAGIQFGDEEDYNIVPDSVEISAACNTSGGTVEIWIDSLDTGKKIGECAIENTGSLTTYQSFKVAVDSVQGSHDVYLKFLTAEASNAFRISSFKFSGEADMSTSVNEQDQSLDKKFNLEQNYPNPFNPSTTIGYEIPQNGFVNLSITDITGSKVKTLVNEYNTAGQHKVVFDGKLFSSGVYFYTLRAGSRVISKKMILMK